MQASNPPKSPPLDIEELQRLIERYENTDSLEIAQAILTEVRTAELRASEKTLYELETWHDNWSKANPDKPFNWHGAVEAMKLKLEQEQHP
jgi:hypothetical protein